MSLRADHDRLHIGSLLGALTQKTKAIELPRKLGIDEHDVDADLLMIEHTHGLVAARAFNHAVATLEQIEGERHANERIALDQNNCDLVGILHGGYKRLTSALRSRQQVARTPHECSQIQRL